MIRKLFLALIIGLLVCSYAVSADTGTYELVRQDVDLYIQNDTNVLIKYDVDFKVTGGNIPWVTVGLPNSNFEVKGVGGAATSAKPRNEAGWSGVYVTLDKTYLPGQTFNYQVSALQKKFVYMHNGNGSVQITPVWWDNAQVKSMKVTFHLPENVTEVTTSDSNAEFGKNEVSWQFVNLPPGARKTVGVTMPVNGTFTVAPEQPAATAPGDASLGGTLEIFMLVFLAAFVFIFLMILLGLALGSGSSDDYEPPTLTLNSALSGKKVKRNVHLTCGKDDKVMEDKKVPALPAKGEKTLDTIAYAVCLLCGSLFFDRGQIEKALKNGIVETQLNTGAKLAPVSNSKLPDKCPRCGGKFKVKTQHKNETSATLLYCPDCGGIWLESGEYANVKKLYEIQRDELKSKGKSEKDADNDHWLFYPYIYYPIITGHTGGSGASGSSGGGSYGGGRYGGGGASSCVSHSSCVSSCACVSCACVACACACACAGGGAAGCSPKNKIGQIDLWDTDDKV